MINSIFYWLGISKDEIEMGELGSGEKNNSETESTEIKVYVNKFKHHENMTLIYFKDAQKGILDLNGITGVEDKGDVNLKNIDNNSTAKKGTKDMGN